MPTHTRFKGVTTVGESLLNDQLEINVREFCSWAALQVGGFVNVTLPGSGAFGGSTSRLRHIGEDPYFRNGKAWEGYRQDWVWESGIEYGTQPIGISGVYVDNTFYPANTTGAYSHYVDYPRGRIIFPSGIPTTSVVQAEFSYKLYHFSTSDAPWFKELHADSFRVDDPSFLQDGSGGWSILSKHRVQMPHVVIEAVPRRTMRGKQLGQGQIVDQDLLFHIYTETPSDRKRLIDWITYQKEKTIYAFNKNTVRMPLNHTGSLASGALTYPDMVNPNGQYFWKKILFADMQVTEQLSSPPLFEAIVRTTCEVHMPEI